MWMRDKDGSYRAELDGWSLEVSWLPDAPGRRGGFHWKASREGALGRQSLEIHEEPEDAMLCAEQFVARDRCSR